MKVKICGITNVGDALMACEFGADLVGVVVSEESKRKVNVEEAKKILDSVPENVLKVVVTTATEVNELQKIADEIKPKVIQMHGEINPGGLEKLKFNGKLTKCIAVEPFLEKKLHQKIDYAEYMKRYDMVDFFLLDSKAKGIIGGTGVVHNWDVSEEIVKISEKPVFLAGGLNPENVKKAIEKVKPYGVDVASGVEKETGKKDLEKVREFIRGAKE